MPRTEANDNSRVEADDREDFHRLKDLNDKVVVGCEYDRSKSMECNVIVGTVQYDSFLHCVFIGVS